MEKTTDKNPTEKALILAVLINATPFFHGLLHAYNIFALSVVLILLLFYIAHKNGLHITAHKVLLGPSILFLGAIIAAFSTTSHGLAIWGCFKLINCGLYILLLIQCSTEERNYALNLLPTVASITTVFCCLFYPILSMRHRFFNDGRLWGFFEYCNAFALYLMIALFILLYKEYQKKHQLTYYIQILILFIGILWTGARFILLLTLFGLFLFALTHKSARLPLCIAVVAGFAGILAAFFIGIGSHNITRILSIVSTPRSLLERFVFWRDGWKLLLMHPLGLGYKGYAMAIYSIQSGHYVTQYVHNDWLQIAIDHGILGFIGFSIFYIMGFRYLQGRERLIFVLIGLCMCMEFCLQFYWVVLLLLTLFNWNERSQVVCKRWVKMITTTAAFVLLFTNTWFALASWAQHIGKYASATTLYPWNWQAQMEYVPYLMGDLETIPYTSARILEQNPYNSTAEIAMAKYYARQNDYPKALDYGWSAIKHNRFDTSYYDSLVQYCSDAISYYTTQGDTSTAQTYIQELGKIASYMSNVDQSRDHLACVAEDNYKPLSFNIISQNILSEYGIE